MQLHALKDMLHAACSPPLLRGKTKGLLPQFLHSLFSLEAVPAACLGPSLLHGPVCNAQYMHGACALRSSFRPMPGVGDVQRLVQQRNTSGSLGLERMPLSDTQRAELLKQLEKRQTHKAGVAALTQLVCAVPLGDSAQQELSALFPVVARVHQLLKARRCCEGMVHSVSGGVGMTRGVRGQWPSPSVGMRVGMFSWALMTNQHLRMELR